jgi:transposase-like protein
MQTSSETASGHRWPDQNLGGPLGYASAVEETFEPGMTVSLVARHGVAANQLFTWCRLVAQGSLTAAGSGEEVNPAGVSRLPGPSPRAAPAARQEAAGSGDSQGSPGPRRRAQKNCCGGRRRRHGTVRDEDGGDSDWRVAIQLGGIARIGYRSPREFIRAHDNP